MRDDVVGAQAVGVDAGRRTWMVVLVSAFGTGLCGAAMFLPSAGISPNAAVSLTDWTASVIVIVVIGGIGTIQGPSWACSCSPRCSRCSPTTAPGAS